MGTIKSIDVRIAVFLKRCFNHYIRKRTYVPPPPPVPTQDDIWESLFINGNYFIFDIDKGINISLYKDSILCKLIYFGFETNEISFIKKFLRRGDVFIDIGANIGLYSLYASKIIGDEGKIYAIEPTPQTFERLVDNIDLNNLTNIEPVKLGLSNIKSVLDFNVSCIGYDAWNSFVRLDNIGVTDKIKVNVDTLDSFISIKNIRNIDLIKIDVEGWEKFVLEGSTDLLTRENAPVILVEFTETNAFAAGYYLGDVYDLMNSHGYNWYSYDSEKNTLTQEIKKLHYPYENLIAIKNINECLNRISE